MRALVYVAIVSLLPAFFVADSPEFMQQYRQRIGGHTSELRNMLRDFDDDARRSSLTRSEALAMMEAKPEKFFRERAVRIKGYEMRLVRLEAQEEMLRYRGSPLTVLNFYRDNDEQVYDETRKVYRWGISTDGALLALMVWMISFAVLGLPALMFGGRSRAEA